MRERVRDMVGVRIEENRIECAPELGNVTVTLPTVARYSTTVSTWAAVMSPVMEPEVRNPPTCRREGGEERDRERKQIKMKYVGQ